MVQYFDLSSFFYFYDSFSYCCIMLFILSFLQSPFKLIILSNSSLLIYVFLVHSALFWPFFISTVDTFVKLNWFFTVFPYLDGYWWKDRALHNHKFPNYCWSMLDIPWEFSCPFGSCYVSGFCGIPVTNEGSFPVFKSLLHSDEVRFVNELGVQLCPLDWWGTCDTA